jgi:molybdenum cofactor biosynthesis protein B
MDAWRSMCVRDARENLPPQTPRLCGDILLLRLRTPCIGAATLRLFSPCLRLRHPTAPKGAKWYNDSSSSCINATPMSHTVHEQIARSAVPSVTCGIITISDTRTPETDTGGALIRTMLEGAGHQVVHYMVVKDEPDQIVAHVREFADAGCQVIITSGGTGIAKRDSTFEAIDTLLEKRMPGFGEIFRVLSYQDIGPAAMLSRATAGVFQRSLIFCLPGSPAAVRLAMEKLIVPELAHLVWETIR